MFLNQKDLHHAYLLEGGREELLPKLLDFLEQELNFQTYSNPDFYLRSFNTFGIDDGKAIIDFQSKKAIVDQKQIIVIQTNFITNEAQNSLLKMFEEPTKDTHIFLIMPFSENLLLTLKSRLTIIRFVKEKFSNDGASVVLAEKFLRTSISQREGILKIFFEQKKGEKADKAGAIQFLNNLEKVLYKNFKNTDEKKVEFKTIFLEINKSRSYLSDRSPSVKMILEHLSNIIPINYE